MASLSPACQKNLTPYDVLVIASMIEKETPAPEERQLVSAVIYNRLHAHMALGIDAALRYGLNIPPTESIHESELDMRHRTTRATPRRPAADPDRHPGLASLQAAAHPAKANYLYFVAKPDKKHHFFTASFAAFERTRPSTATDEPRRVALLGKPVAESLSPRMQNAAFAARRARLGVRRTRGRAGGARGCRAAPAGPART